MLERIQARRNRLLAAKNNFSGANDAHQTVHDSNDFLIAGAADIAAANHLGMSEQQLLQQQSRRRRLNARQEEADAWAQEHAKEMQAANSNVDFDESGELSGYRSVSNADLEERDQSDLQTTILHGKGWF